MTKLNQLLAIEKSAKSNADRALSEAYNTLRRPDQFAGMTRTYQPKDDEGDQLPDESKRIQRNVPDLIGSINYDLSRLLGVVLEKDTTNTLAVADVVVEGMTLLRDVPVTTLLWLEKKLAEFRNLINSIPTLDRGEQWELDGNVRAYVTPSVKTHKTRKVPRSHVLYEATDRHPAQVQPYTEDEVVGYWSTVKTSTAIPESVVADARRRVDTLADAVKQAREEANNAEVSPRSGDAEAVYHYVFGPIATLF